jgi:hypothetical protein
LTSKLVAMVFFSLALKPVVTFSFGLVSNPVVSFLVEPQNQSGEGFSGLGLKIGSYGLMIWVSKIPRQFFGLCLKTKRATVYWLSHKTDVRMRRRGTRIKI